MNVARIISPHLDDAVLSLGQFMAATECVVYTVCAGDPPANLPNHLSAYDRDTGFGSSSQAMRQRRQEDQRAMEVLGVDEPVHWELRDHQYRLHEANPAFDTERLSNYVKGVMRTVSRNAGDRIFVPLGLGHPDHRTVADVCREVLRSGTMFFYEELPYRIINPIEVTVRIRQMTDEGWRFQEHPYPLTPHEPKIKAEAISKYVSQYPDGPDHMVMCPERVWRAAR